MQGRGLTLAIARRAQASLAMDHDVDVAIGVVAHGDRLQDTLLPDARRQLLQTIGIECAARLIGISCSVPSVGPCRVSAVQP